MKFYIYNCHFDTDSYTVIFDSNTQLNEVDLSSELKIFHDHKGISQFIAYIHPSNCTQENLILSKIESAANISQDCIIKIPYNSKGIIHLNNLVKKLTYEGVKNILISRSLVLSSDDEFHYVNPNQKHSPFFIRAGTALTEKNEIDFIALHLLKYLADETITEIHCDTASIISLIYACGSLKNIFGESLKVNYSTFNSYSNLTKIKRGSLVIISASSSGGLEEEIINEKIDCEIVTLIYNNEKTIRIDGKERNIIINVSSFFHELLPTGHNTISYSIENCEYCDNNSIPVTVRGDHFIPSKVAIQSVLFNITQVPKYLKEAINELCCTNSIHVNSGDNRLEKTRDIFINLKSILKAEGDFLTRFQRFAKNDLALTTDLIITFDDESSQYLSEMIKAYIKLRRNGFECEIIKQSEISDSFNERDPSTILIVSSCVSNGNRLNSLSRTLRTLTKSSLHYLIGILRLSDENASRVLQNNLKSRNGKVEQNKVHVLLEIFLPNNNSKKLRKQERSPWLEEVIFLEQELNKSPDSEIKEILEKRIKEIEYPSNLINKIFYHNPYNNKPLELRPNFAFHNFEANQIPSQSDVYFIFCSIIHGLRNPRILNNGKINLKSQKYLIHHEHIKSIIDPENFRRVNDGIIQAAILRLLYPNELDYSSNEDYSSKMFDTLKSIFNSLKTDSSEAILEFLYAMAIKKLRLTQPHMEEFCRHIREVNTNQDVWINFFLEKLNPE